MTQECKTCSAYTANDDMQGLCRAHPPTASVIMIPRGTIQAQLVPQPISSLPTTPSNGWCREWQEAQSQLIRMN